MNLKVIEALACWGGSLPIELIKKILEEKSEKNDNCWPRNTKT